MTGIGEQSQVLHVRSRNQYRISQIGKLSRLGCQNDITVQRVRIGGWHSLSARFCPQRRRFTHGHSIDPYIERLLLQVIQPPETARRPQPDQFPAYLVVGYLWQSREIAGFQQGSQPAVTFFTQRRRARMNQ